MTTLAWALVVDEEELLCDKSTLCMLCIVHGESVFTVKSITVSMTIVDNFNR